MSWSKIGNPGKPQPCRCCGTTTCDGKEIAGFYNGIGATVNVSVDWVDTGARQASYNKQAWINEAAITPVPTTQDMIDADPSLSGEWHATNHNVEVRSLNLEPFEVDLGETSGTNCRFATGGAGGVQPISSLLAAVAAGDDPETIGWKRIQGPIQDNETVEARFPYYWPGPSGTEPAGWNDEIVCTIPGSSPPQTETIARSRLSNTGFAVSKRETLEWSDTYAVGSVDLRSPRPSVSILVAGVVRRRVWQWDSSSLASATQAEILSSQPPLVSDGYLTTEVLFHSSSELEYACDQLPVNNIVLPSTSFPIGFLHGVPRVSVLGISDSGSFINTWVSEIERNLQPTVQTLDQPSLTQDHTVRLVRTPGGTLVHSHWGAPLTCAEVYGSSSDWFLPANDSTRAYSGDSSYVVYVNSWDNLKVTIT